MYSDFSYWFYISSQTSSYCPLGMIFKSLQKCWKNVSGKMFVRGGGVEGTKVRTGKGSFITLANTIASPGLISYALWPLRGRAKEGLLPKLCTHAPLFLEQGRRMALPINGSRDYDSKADNSSPFPPRWFFRKSTLYVKSGGPCLLPTPRPTDWDWFVRESEQDFIPPLPSIGRERII